MWPYALDAPGVVLNLPRREALLGWRVFGVTPDGALVAPYFGGVSAHLYAPGIRWSPGVNVATSRYCPADARSHPSPARECRCGIRAIRSREALDRFREVMTPSSGLPLATARVALHGRVAGYAEGDDWRHTLRATHDRIVGGLDLHRADAAVADRLGRRYEVELRPSPTDA